MGAVAAFNIKDVADFSALVRGANNGRGVEVVLDPVGASYVGQNLEVLEMDGRLVLYGLMGGKGVEDGNFLGKILAKRISIIGSTLRGRTKPYKQDLAEAVEAEVVNKVVGGEYKVLIDSVFPMTTEGVRQAHQLMAANQNIGKIVLTVA
jgi:NADPH:quinone reductase-like Zn-dependent oxidoreductase